MPTIRHASILVLLVCLSACRNSAAPEVESPLDEPSALPALQEPPPPVVAGGLLLASSADLWGDESTPVRVHLGVTARNTTSHAVPLDGLCILQIRAFSDQTGAPVWRSPQRPAASCPSPPAAQAIPPGGRFTLRAAERSEYPEVLDILGDSLPEGRYAFGALVRVGADTVAVPAGLLPLSADTRPPLQDADLLTYAAETRVDGVAPSHLVARVVAMNETNRNVYLEYGACSLRLRAYRTPQRTGRPVWRSENRRRPGSSYGYVCLDYLATNFAAPGEVISPPEFNASIPIHEVLGDSLPDGRYYFTAVLRFQRGAGTTLAHDSISAPAGSADLSSAVDPLPQEREVGGIHYRADASRDAAAPGMLHIALTATNVGAAHTFVVGSRGVTCPTQLLGYRDAEQRDRWYLAERADWFPRECPLRIPSTWLAPGESRTFTGAVPGSAREEGSGRYYLALVLTVEQEPHGGSRVVLSAGDAILGED